MGQFRKKLVFEAVQFNGAIDDSIRELFGNTAISVEDGKLVFLTSIGETARIPVGNWIIKGTSEGAFFSCDPELFEATYEPVS